MPTAPECSGNISASRVQPLHPRTIIAKFPSAFTQHGNIRVEGYLRSSSGDNVRRTRTIMCFSRRDGSFDVPQSVHGMIPGVYSDRSARAAPDPDRVNSIRTDPLESAMPLDRIL